VQTSTTLNNPNWVTVQETLVDSTGLFYYTDTVTGGSGFYRAIIKP